MKDTFIAKVKSNLEDEGIITQLNKALDKVFTPMEIEELGFGVDTEDELTYNWHMTYEDRDYTLTYYRAIGIIAFMED